MSQVASQSGFEVSIKARAEKTDDCKKPKVSSGRIWVLRVCFGVFVPFLLLGLVEAALRTSGVGYPTDVTVPCTIQSRPAACYNMFFAAPFFPPGMIKMPQMYAIPGDKAPGTFRIFVLGESAAMGDPEPAFGFSRYLEVMLRESYPGIKFEIFNTGSVAINSHVILPIARGLAKQKPDLFIIYSGNNEVVGPYGPGTTLTESGMSLPVIRTSIFFHSTRIGQLLTKLGTPKREWGGMAMFLDKQVRASSPLMKYAYSNYEENLHDTINVARQTGARVIVATVATNLLGAAPFASLHREDRSQDALSTWTALEQRGVEQETAGSYAEALQSYQAAAAIDGEYAELEFRIGRCLMALGNYSVAKEHFVRARDLDTLRFRADSRINEVTRSVATSYTGIGFVDADTLFAGETFDRASGNELFYDHVHLSPQGNYLLARSMFLQVANQLASGIGRSLQAHDVPSQAECERRLAFTKYDRSRATTDMLRRLQEPPFTNQLNHSDQLLRLMSQTENLDENPDDTAAQYQWAIEKSPEDKTLHYNFGVFLNPYNPGVAAEQFNLARPFDGFPLVTADGTVH